MIDCYNPPLLDPTNDFVFKALYANEDSPWSKRLLIMMLNIVLECDDDPITDIEYKNPFSIGTDSTEKVIVMDIKIHTNRGERINVEMQIVAHRDYPARMVYYQGKDVSAGLLKGQDYDKIEPSISISFVKGILFPEIDKLHTSFCFKEVDLPEVNLHPRAPSIHFVEMGKLDIADKALEELTELEALCVFLMHANDKSYEDLVFSLMDYRKGGIVDMSMKALNKVSEDERLRYLAESRAKFLFDINCARREAVEEGHAEGHAEGLAEGHAEGVKDGIALINKMIEAGLTNEIQRVTTDEKYRAEMLTRFGIQA